jgi:hypothetical protein
MAYHITKHERIAILVLRVCIPHGHFIFHYYLVSKELCLILSSKMFPIRCIVQMAAHSFEWPASLIYPSHNCLRSDVIINICVLSLIRVSQIKLLYPQILFLIISWNRNRSRLLVQGCCSIEHWAVRHFIRQVNSVYTLFYIQGPIK